MSKNDRVDRFLVKLGTIALFSILTVLFICLVEFFSWVTLTIQDKLNNSFFMLSYSDDAIKHLYNTEDPKSYKEMLDETWGREMKYEPFLEYGERPYDGKYVKISKDGYRYIKNQEVSFIDKNKINIFVFGGSTTFGYGVKNEETIPSYIQEILRVKYGKTNIAVYNLGAASYYSTIERIKFENLLASGYKPDMVIFIDGLNDFYYYQVPDRTAVSDKLETISQLEDSGIKTKLQGVFNNIAQHSQTVKLTLKIIKLLGYKKIKDEKELESIYMTSDQNLSKAAYRLMMNRLMIKDICEKSDITPVFVQQPVPVYHFNNATRVVPLPIAAIEKHVNSKNGYNLMVEKYKKKSFSNDNVLWLEDLAISGNQYVDAVHYSPQYNYAIADNIVDYINNNKLLKNKR